MGKINAFKDIVVVFTDKGINFPKGYCFKHSQLYSNKELTAAQLTEVNLYTAPPSFVLNDKEVIFIPYQYKDELEAFAKRNHISISNRFDIWSAINEPFLDTVFDAEDQAATLKNLVDNGLTAKEVKAIRHKIGPTMLAANAIVWEWANLSQFDYLNWSKPTAEKYWWSMGIALRNCKKRQ